MNDDQIKKIAKLIEARSFHRAPTVIAEPHVELVRWSLRQVSGNFNNNGDTLHLVGYGHGEGRVCSPLVAFDLGTMTAITRSGRRYQLLGPPGWDADAEYVWKRWIAWNRNPAWTDVTSDYLEHLERLNPQESDV